MPKSIQEAQDLIRQAEAAGKCLDLVRELKRRLAELDDASRAGNAAIGLGLGVIVVGVGTALLGVIPLGIGLMAAGAVGASVGLDTKAGAMKSAARKLEWAMEDLQACLG